MGHQRLGRLPLRRNWRKVLETLSSPDESVADIAAVTAKAAEQALRDAPNNPYVWYPFWIITQLASSAKNEATFREFLSAFGISGEHDSSVLNILTCLTAHVSDKWFDNYPRNAFSDLASDAFHEALGEIIKKHTKSLFSPTLEDVRKMFANHATPTGVADIIRTYLGSFFGRVLAFFVSYNISNYIGPNKRFHSLLEAETFNQALYTYSREVSLLVRDFGKGWYSKSLWEKGTISPETAQRFLYIAFRKFRQQLELEAT